MAVKLRLRRTGAKHQPRYRIVATDARSPRDGRFIEVLGHYDPTRQPHEVAINAELARKWLSRGAQPTDTVRQLLVEQGILVAAYTPAGEGAAAEPVAAVEVAAAAQPTLSAAPVAEKPPAAPEAPSAVAPAETPGSGAAPSAAETPEDEAPA
jgi:small subunit ribosomal protein S16